MESVCSVSKTVSNRRRCAHDSVHRCNDVAVRVTPPEFILVQCMSADPCVPTPVHVFRVTACRIVSFAVPTHRYQPTDDVMQIMCNERRWNVRVQWKRYGSLASLAAQRHCRSGDDGDEKIRWRSQCCTATVHCVQTTGERPESDAVRVAKKHRYESLHSS